MSIESLAWLAWVALGAALAYVAAALFLYLMQRRIIYASSREEPLAEPLDGRMPEEIFSTAPDGPRCRHWLWTARDPDKPLIVLLQGNAGHIGHRLDCYDFLVEAGFGLCLVGYRGFSGNPGQPDEAGLIADAEAAISALRARLPGVTLILYGESLGAAVAIAVAAHGERAPMILDCPFDSLVSSAKRRYPWLIVSPLLKERWDSIARIGSVTQPLLWVHGSEDPVTPCSAGRRLFEAAPGPKTSLVVEGGGHLGLYDEPEARKTLFDWLARYGKLDALQEQGRA